MVKLEIQNENGSYGGLYTELGAVKQIIDIIHNSDEVEIKVEYKNRGQAVGCKSSRKD